MNSIDPSDQRQALCEEISLACAQKRPLRIVGGNSKPGFRYAHTGDIISLRNHSGIIDYAPAELVITARAGTPLQQLEDTLRQQRQMLAFEPPHFGSTATLGGTIACGLSGPRRPYTGAVRDFVLGTDIINGQGQALSFGGRVMKNVAGYDLSRLMAGALGTLGLITEISLKVLPRPEAELTLQFDINTETAIKQCNEWAGKSLPLSGTCIRDNQLYLRLSGSTSAVQATHRKLGGEIFDSRTFWISLREQTHPFFTSTDKLWRLSVAPATPLLPLDGEWLMEWGGGQRWLKTNADSHQVLRVVTAAGGQATLFDRTGRQRNLQPLDAGLLALHKRVKRSLDPGNILNPGALYADV